MFAEISTLYVPVNAEFYSSHKLNSVFSAFLGSISLNAWIRIQLIFITCISSITDCSKLFT